MAEVSLVNNVPTRTEDVEGFAEAVVVDETRIDGEGAHEKNDVTTREYQAKNLQKQCKSEPLLQNSHSVHFFVTAIVEPSKS